MAPRKKATPRPSNPYGTSTTDPDELSPANRVAHEILVQRGDLLPSIERIMGAGLPEEGAVQALTLFRDALVQPGDPNRDPRVAIAAATDDQVSQP